jgi:SM-20-related protein
MSDWLVDFEKQGWAVLDDFLDEASALGIRSELSEIQIKNEFKRASIGRLEQKMVDTSQRGDFICWINPELALPHTGSYLQKMNEIIELLNYHFFLGIRDYECHYALYPPGTYYKKHVDRHKTGSPRRVSSVLYLNPNWSEQDGGELVIYSQETNHAFRIMPSLGKLVIFLSELEHEVLPTQVDRMSITGWMLNEKIL